MVVTVLYRVERGERREESEESEDVGSGSRFSDVVAGSWYFDAVQWAASNGIVSGYSDGRFGPDDEITREQLAVILNNYARFASMSIPVVRESPRFNDDADIADYAREAIERFFRARILSGKPDNTFDPKGSATRAEFAAMLMNFPE